MRGGRVGVILTGNPRNVAPSEEGSQPVSAEKERLGTCSTTIDCIK